MNNPFLEDVFTSVDDHGEAGKAAQNRIDKGFIYNDIGGDFQDPAYCEDIRWSGLMPQEKKVSEEKEVKPC